MKIKIKYAIPVLTLVITLVVVLIITSSQAPADSQEKTEKTNVDYDKLDEVVFNVETEPVKRGDLIISTTANGIVRAAKELDISPSIGGYIREINIYEGKKVDENDLLIQLDDREYQIELKEADDLLIEAKVEYGFLMKDSPFDTASSDIAVSLEEEITKLDEKYKAGKIDDLKYHAERDSLEMKLIFTGAKREELILNKSGYNRARNAKERARLKIEHTKIRAPFGGVVGNFNLVSGQRINAGEAIFKLLDNSKLLIDVGVIESEIPLINKGNYASITLNAIPYESYDGKVVSISPYVDPEKKTCKVTVKIDDPDKSIKSGMFVSVTIETRVLRNRILIPKDALLIRDQRELVFVVEDSLSKWRYVDIGEQNESFIEITNGVEEGEEVIVKGHYTLAHDTVVNIIR